MSTISNILFSMLSLCAVFAPMSSRAAPKVLFAHVEEEETTEEGQPNLATIRHICMLGGSAVASTPKDAPSEDTTSEEEENTEDSIED